MDQGFTNRDSEKDLNTLLSTDIHFKVSDLLRICYILPSNNAEDRLRYNHAHLTPGISKEYVIISKRQFQLSRRPSSN